MFIKSNCQQNFKKIFSLFFFVLFVLISLTNSKDIFAANISVSGKAKILNTNNSYLNFTLYDSNVVINDSTGVFSGYAWIDDLGWVAFGTTDNDDGPVTLNLANGAVTGKAKVLNTDDFLNFTTNNSNVTVELATGVFSGHVWSEDVGWIDFTNTGVSSASFLQTQNTTSDNNSSSTNSSTSNSVCTDSKPLFLSDLFQINTTNNSAKLFFTPLADTSNFYISFSQNSNAEEHGEQVILIREGVQSHTIYQLKPNTVYYTKVRGQNGCNPGDWSNIMKFKTDSKIYYKNSTIFNKITSTIKKITNNLVIQPIQKSTPIPIIQTQQNKDPKPSPITPEIKKKCFLWWCW